MNKNKQGKKDITLETMTIYTYKKQYKQNNIQNKETIKGVK